MNYNIYNPGSILKVNNTRYYDQLDYPNTFGARTKYEYLKNKYNLSWQEYVNLIYYEDKDFIPRCPICGEPTRFYQVLRTNGTYYNEACSKSCMVKLMIKRGTHASILGNHRLSGYAPYNRISLEYSCQYNRSIKLGHKVLQFYYVIEDSNWIKFGITMNTNKRKIHAADITWMKDKELVVLKEGPFDKICKLEYDCKFKFTTEDIYKETHSYERIRFHQLNELIKYVTDYDI